MDIVRYSWKVMIVSGIAIMISSCAKSNNPVDVGDLSLPSTVELQAGQSILLTDVDVLITFDSTLIDNRSISGDGIEAGYASISISFRPFFGQSVRYSLYTTEGPQEVDWEEYRILLVALNPLPQTGTAINGNAYVATIGISKILTP